MSNDNDPLCPLPPLPIFGIIYQLKVREGVNRMRVLATVDLSFAVGCGLSGLLPWDGWQLYAAAAVRVCALAVLALKKQLGQKTNLRLRLLLILFSLAASLV